MNTHRYISIFVFRGFWGHHRVCLHASGQGGCMAVRTYRALGEWQETEQEFRCVSGDRRIGQQDGEGGEEALRLNRD